ncbi:MAG: ATP-binding cassette domain-containing protein, partial [Planctomycetota bacterium]|nr:ATP-binding cassette domain-containing protein [Planctomycetota bacterium]
MSIAVERFQKSYDNIVAVDDLTFRVEPGEILGLVGPNGAGKTTTLRSIAGILRPSRGRILIDGHDIVLDAIEAKRALAYVPDEPGLFEGLSV